MEDFKPRQHDELEFFAHETVYLLRRLDDDWFVGEVVSGETGLVPANRLGMWVHQSRVWTSSAGG